MVKVETSRGGMFLRREDSGPTGITMSLGQPVDDLIALASAKLPSPKEWEGWDADTRVFIHPGEERVHNLWAGEWRFLELFEKGDETARAARRLVRNGVPATFEAAARTVSRGRFPADLTPYLSKIHFSPDYDDLPPDIAVIASWSLLQLLHSRRPFNVRRCDFCDVPFLASLTAKYCTRLAPGSLQTKCLDAGSLRDHRVRKRQEKGGTTDGRNS